jgi:hypothetical protein
MLVTGAVSKGGLGQCHYPKYFRGMIVALGHSGEAAGTTSRICRKDRDCYPGAAIFMIFCSG